MGRKVVVPEPSEGEKKKNPRPDLHGPRGRETSGSIHVPTIATTTTTSSSWIVVRMSVDDVRVRWWNTIDDEAEKKREGEREKEKTGGRRVDGGGGGGGSGSGGMGWDGIVLLS